jgi:hypothetical protein
VLKPIQMTSAFLMVIALVVTSSGVLVERTGAEGYNLVDEVSSVPPVVSPSCDGSSACDCCPGCNSPCCACRDCCCCSMEKNKVKKHCWNVSCEKVCIPPVCMPSCCCCGWLPKWCCPCAKCRVRCISVLEKHEYECEECKCRWEVRCVPVDCGGCCDCAAMANPAGDSVVGWADKSEIIQQPSAVSSIISSVPRTVEDQPITLISVESIRPGNSDAGLSTTQQPVGKDQGMVSRFWSWARSEK